MKNKSFKDSAEKRYSTKQWVLFITGIVAIIIGTSFLGAFGIRKIHRELQKQKMFRENIVIEIPDIKIKAPVLEGIDNETLSKATGHFPDTGSVGTGNYCIAGHSSTIYKEYFNNLKNIESGMKINLYDIDKKQYVYTVTEKFIVEPDETWILNDYSDNRITIITCTDDGKQRQVVVGMKDN